jgi:DNA-binding GntR family transcriptional regulator
VTTSASDLGYWIQDDAAPLGAGDEPLPYRTLQDLTTDRLRTAILRGRFPPGARLHHDTLARQFGVSRMPVRQALRVLHSEGLIELRPHRGAVVIALDPEEILQIFEVRGLLEARAAELAAPNLTDADLAHLAAIVSEMEAAEADDDRWLALNLQFHTGIYPASGWRHLCTLIESQRNVVQPYLRVALAFLDRARTARAEHRGILAAAQARDGPRLARLTVNHLRTTARAVVDELARRQTTSTADSASGGLHGLAPPRGS